MAKKQSVLSIARAAREAAPFMKYFGLPGEASLALLTGALVNIYAAIAVAVNIQSTSGGNLAEILDGLAKVIRARFKLFRRVKAITAEARWSGWFLSIFPLVALVLINVMQPGYYDEVQKSSFFVPAAIIVAAFLIVNVIFMRIMVNIKV